MLKSEQVFKKKNHYQTKINFLEFCSKMEMIQSDRDCDKIRKKVLILSSVLFTVQGRKFFFNEPLQ